MEYNPIAAATAAVEIRKESYLLAWGVGSRQAEDGARYRYESEMPGLSVDVFMHEPSWTSASHAINRIAGTSYGPDDVPADLVEMYAEYMAAYDYADYALKEVVKYYLDGRGFYDQLREILVNRMDVLCGMMRNRTEPERPAIFCK